MKIRDYLNKKEFVIKRNGKDISICRFSKENMDVIERVNLNQYGADIKIIRIHELTLTDILNAEIVPNGTYKKKFDALAEFVKSEFSDGIQKDSN